MDFFEAQEQSRQRSRRLLLWLIPALGFLFLGSHLIAVMAFRAIPYDLTGDFRQIYGDQRHGLGELFRHPRVIAASQIPILLTLIFTIGRKWRELSLGGGALLLEKLGARRLSYFASPAERRLKNVVEEVAIAAGTSVPVIFVLDREPSINALCAGFSPHEAVIGVTQGALEQLNRDELQGLVAHEFGHILNGDLVLNMRLVSLLNGALQISLAGLYLAVFGHAVLAFVVAYLGSTQGGALGMALAFLVTIVGALLLITGSVGMIGGRAAQMAVARERELLADAAAVQLARLNTGLAGALSKA
ncbi:MAG: peptidase M48, partial [Rhodospirillales bacterium]